jgi:hypothetical protein
MFREFLEKNDLRALLRPGLPYPAGEDRGRWEGLSLGAKALEDAKEAAGKPYPLLMASAFMAYVRTGDRRIYEEPYFERRHHLIRTAIGECLQWQGAFLTDVADGLWLLAEETSWVVSAHNVDDHPGRVGAADRPLPDRENPVIDLFAAQTGATVTLVCHLLAEKLDGITPMIRQRMRAEVERRILRPFFQRDDFWWMGMIRRDVNNWTPWILSGILICLLYWERESSRLAEGARRAMEMLERYLNMMPGDGGCDEGVGYWNMAGASLLDCLELIRHATGGRADFYDHPKIRAIGAFPAHAHIAGPYFWNFADCDARPLLDGERVWQFGVRTGNEKLKALGAQLMTGEQDPWPRDTPQMSRVLDRLFFASQEEAGKALARSAAQGAGEGSGEGADGGPEATILPDLQVLALRKGPYYAAIKGGHNGENHNHNDVGSFLLYIGGEPAIVDAGNMVYTAKTFSSERYTLWNTRSRNHNVPLIGGFEQRAGAAYGAADVVMNSSGMSMELEGCYPEECGLISFRRQGSMGEGGFRLWDQIALERPGTVEWVFLLREEPSLLPGVCRAGALRLRFPTAFKWAVEAYPVMDPRMKRNYPGSLWRLSLMAVAGRTHEAELIMEEYK